MGGRGRGGQPASAWSSAGVATSSTPGRRPLGLVGTYPKDVDLMWTRLTRQKGRCGLHRERRADRPETREPYRHSELLTIHGERSSDDLLVVAGVDVSVGIRGMRPVHGRQLAAIAGRGGWLQKLGAADLLKSLGRQRCDDELAAIVVDEDAVTVLHGQPGRPARAFLRHLERFPDALARFCQ